MSTMFNEMPIVLQVVDLMIREYDYFFSDGSQPPENTPLLPGQSVENGDADDSVNKITLDTQVPEEGLWVKAAFPYEAQDDGELSFQAGDSILLTGKDPESEWWPALLNDQPGYVPINFLELSQ